MLKEGLFYHIYNRGIDGNNIFFSDEDFGRFLSKYTYYLSLSVETIAYCLMKNHFHILIKILASEDSKRKQSLAVSSDKAFYIVPNPKGKYFKAERLFGHLFNSHTKYINKKYNRSGTLWDGNFKNRQIDSVEYLQHCVCYIHRNPIHHGLTSSYEVYPYSSYLRCLDPEYRLISNELISDIFGNRDNYIAAHKEVHIALNNEYRIENI